MISIKKNKVMGIIVSVAMAVSISVPQLSVFSDATQSVEAASEFNYAEALQKSLFFYECQQAGPLPDWNEVEWRADSTVDDYIQGGWYDAGDHVKFNLPMAYSATMLAWGLYEYGDGVKNAGLFDTYKNNLEFALDYFVDCDLGDEVVFQVGNGQQDHTWWGPVELLEYGMAENGVTGDRPYYTGKSSAVCGEMAASLAAGAVALKGSSSKTSEYLEHAKNMFTIADTERSDDEYQNSDASGFYRSSHFYDELFWAANWLYIATNDQYYLDKATSYIPYLGKELGTSELKYSWGQCWDDVQQGGMLLYARNTQSSVYIEQVKKHLNYWCDSVTELDGGLRWLSTWGCLRYAQSAAFLASVASDTLITDQALINKYTTFAEEQINYALGDNPDNQSYVVGFGEDYPLNAHHRTAHSSWNNSLPNPLNNRHILYGALVGGPTQDGNYVDDRQNFINNEVATDYNAGFTAILCKMVDEYGGTKDSSFPQAEQRDDEFFVEAMIKQNSAAGTSVSLKFTNHTAWPARVEDNMSYRYYLDLTEVISSGYTADDVVIRVDRDQAKMYTDVTPANVSKMIHYKDNIYYIEVTYADGRAAIPISEGRHQCELMLALVFPNYQSGWDASNDYSNKDILNSEDSLKTDKITVYQNGVLLYGTEPDGTTPSKENQTSEILGDVDCNGKVSVADIVLMKKHILAKKTLTTQGYKNADMNKDGEVNVFDTILLLKSFL